MKKQNKFKELKNKAEELVKNIEVDLTQSLNVCSMCNNVINQDERYNIDSGEYGSNYTHVKCIQSWLDGTRLS